MNATIKPKIQANIQMDIDSMARTVPVKVRKNIPRHIGSRNSNVTSAGGSRMALAGTYGSAGPPLSTRSASSKSSSFSAAPTASAGRRGSASRKGSATGSRARVEQEADWEEEEEDGIRFINVPSSATSTRSGAVTAKIGSQPPRPITVQRVLQCAQETECSRVYDVDLHAGHIHAIENLEKFVKLKVLDLSCNYIKVIDNLDKNTELKELKLYDNNLTTIDNLDKLKDLNTLQLQHNKITKIGKGLAAIRRLRVLRLDSNALSRVEVREVATLGQLTSLDVNNNQLDDISFINSLPVLEEFYARSNRLRTISDISRCKKLQDLDLSNNRITDLTGLRNLPQVTVLNISHNQLTSLKTLGKLKSLEELFAVHNRLTEFRLSGPQHPVLQIVDIGHNHIEHTSQLSCLAEFSELVELFVAGNPCSTAATYTADLQTALPQLHILDGVQLVRPSSARGGTPLMRPMSAASIVSARQVEAQLINLSDEINSFEMDLNNRFESLRQGMASLPDRAPTSVPELARPLSKCGKRSRLRLAMEFAASIDLQQHTERDEKEQDRPGRGKDH